MSTETTDTPIPILPTVPDSVNLPDPVTAEIEARAPTAFPSEEAAEPEPDPKPKPSIDDAPITPKDTVDALRMMRKLNLVEPDDDAATRKHITNMVVTYIAQKRVGVTDQDFETWYTTPGLDDEPTDAEDETVDPT